MTATFDEELARFQRFLESNGYPKEVVWITPADLIVTGKQFVYVRVPVRSENDSEARALFEQGTTHGKGVLFDTVCVGERETFCQAWVRRDDDQAQRALMPNGLKLSLRLNKIQGRPVRLWLRWLSLRLRWWKYQELKNDLFWLED